MTKKTNPAHSNRKVSKLAAKASAVLQKRIEIEQGSEARTEQDRLRYAHLLNNKYDELLLYILSKSRKARKLVKQRIKN